MAAKRETTMSAGEGPSGGGVNPMLETRVHDWILSDSDEGPSSGKEQRASEGAVKWPRGLPHVCEHKCLATTTTTARQVALNLTAFLLVL
jgi:hypothetical protein